MIENIGSNGFAGNHPNLLQWEDPVTNSALVEFNTTDQPSGGVAAGEGFQFDPFSGFAVTNPSLEFNTMIAAGSGGGTAASYMVHGNNPGVPFTTGGVISNNYMDVTGAFGAFYAGSFSSGWTLSNNFNMVTGGTFSNNP